jgi:hypothetical protein
MATRAEVIRMRRREFIALFAAAVASRPVIAHHSRRRISCFDRSAVRADSGRIVLRRWVFPRTYGRSTAGERTAASLRRNVLAVGQRGATFLSHVMSIAAEVAHGLSDRAA